MANFRDPEPCKHWNGTEFCGVEPIGVYVSGWRCAEHTPSALKGLPEPGRTATPWEPLWPTPTYDVWRRAAAKKSNRLYEQRQRRAYGG